MQVVDHIVTCPLLNQERGLEPYPQPVVCFAASVSGTAQVRIYDTSVQPMVELTTSALSGAELSAVTATGLSYAYTLDMGHANVTSVVDLMTREGFEGVVMFEDSGGTGEKIYVKISANTQEQVAFLYPDNAIYLDRNATSTGTNFPDGSIFRPVNLIADACSLVTSRQADILDVVGLFTPATDEWTHSKVGTSLHRKQIRCRPGQSARIQNTDVNGLSLDGCHIKGFNRNLSLRNDINNSSQFRDNGSGGTILIEDCQLWYFGSYGAAAAPIIKNCFVERPINGSGDPPYFIDCEFGTLGYVDLGSFGYARYARFIRPSGEKLTLTGNYADPNAYLTITDVKGMLPIDILISIRNGTNITVTGAYGDLQIDGLAHAQPPNVVATRKLAGLDDLTGNVVNLAAGSITPTEAPNLDVAVSSVGGGGGAASAIDVSDHIRTCPLLNQQRGLEPYPQPLVTFAAAPTGTVQARIYDTSVQPMVELTSTALSGAELTLSTATGLSHTYVLDMGHANVTAVVDAMNREGLKALVMIEDNGGSQGQKFVKVTCNDFDHVRELYPDNAVYLDRGAATSATTFPNGSIYQPVNLVADACALVTSRGADVLDVVGQFTPSTDEWTHAKIGTTLEGKQIRCRPGKSGQINSHDAVGLSLDGCHIKGFNRNLSLRNDTNNNSGFEGGIVVEDCNLWNFGSNGNTGTFPVIKNCFVERMVDGSGNPPIWIDCEFGSIGYVDIGDYSNHRSARFIRPSGEKLTIVGNYQGSTRYLSITDVKGMLPIDISVSVRNGTNITVTGAYGELVIGGLAHAQPPVVTTSKLAGYDDLTGNVVNLAAGSITPTEAPNLDVAVSSVGGGGGGTDWTTTEKSQIRHRLSLDGTHAVPTSTHGDIYDLTTRLTAARAGNLDNLDAAITTLATSAALGTVDTNVDTLIARLTAGRATNLDNLDAASSTLATSSALSSVASDVSTVLTRVGTDDIAILKGMLLGNYVLDGGSGAADISYDTNGHASTQRIRVFADAAATTAATKGAANGADSEIARVDISSAPVSGKPFPKNVTGTLT